MDIKIELGNIDVELPISERLSVPVSADIKNDVKRIKDSSRRNRKIVNELSRKFFAQLIAKYDAGEFEESA